MNRDNWSMVDLGLPELSYIDQLTFENTALKAEIVTLKKQLEEANAKNKRENE